MKRLFVCPAIALFISVIAIDGQSPPAPAFDVSSVKRNTSPGPMRMRNAPGNFSATNVPVRQLIRMAYQLQDFQIVGGPDWATRDSFDVEGRFDPAAPLPGFDTPAQKMFAMLKTLLRDRFGMVARMDTRELPVLALTVVRADGKLGPQMQRSAVDCAALAPGPGRGPVAGRGGPAPGRIGAAERSGGLPPPDGRGGPPPPGTPFSLGERPVCGDQMGFGRLLAGGMPIGRLAGQVLSQLTGRVVIDRTGLTGTYDVDLKWTPTPDQLPPGPPPPGVEPPPIDPNGPSLFAALQEQLGLKLEAERGPVEVLVIERLEPPSEN